MDRDCKRLRESSDVAHAELQPLAGACDPEDIFNLPLTEDYFIVDTRSAVAFEAAHLPTARSLPTPMIGAVVAGLPLEAYATAWMNAELEHNAPEQKSRAVVLGNPAAMDNREVLVILACTISKHPCFQRIADCRVLALEEGHDSVVAKYPFLSGKIWEDLPATYPSQVQPRLFLGSSSAAKSKQVFEHLGIGAVVNAARELPKFYEGDETLCATYMKLPLDDDPLQDLEESIEKALPFMKLHLQEGRTVLVHCHMGQSRSVAVVLAHLMATLGCGYDKALSIVRHARPAARPNEGFQAELRAMEGRLIYGPKE